MERNKSIFFTIKSKIIYGLYKYFAMKSSLFRSVFRKIFVFISENNQKKAFLSIEKYIHLLKINTYDKYNQLTHVDVIYDEFTKSEPKYFMVATPYPYGDDRFENPSLYSSSDGIEWNDYGINPIISSNNLNGAYFSDPDIIKTNGVFRIYFRERTYDENGKIDRILSIESSDLLSWSHPKVLLEAKNQNHFSPAAVELMGKIFVFYVKFTNKIPSLVRCIDNDNAFVDIVEAKIAGIPEGGILWHIDVVIDGSTLHGAFTISNIPNQLGKELYYGTSTNEGLSWQIIGRIKLPEKLRANSRFIYRSSFVKTNNDNWELFLAIGMSDYSWHLLKYDNFRFEIE